jgi:hypothetical protein
MWVVQVEGGMGGAQLVVVPLSQVGRRLGCCL